MDVKSPEEAGLKPAVNAGGRRVAKGSSPALKPKSDADAPKPEAEGGAEGADFALGHRAQGDASAVVAGAKDGLAQEERGMAKAQAASPPRREPASKGNVNQNQRAKHQIGQPRKHN